MITVRTLAENEKLPEGFHSGFEAAKLMPEWCWLAEDDGQPVGVMLGAPCHAFVYLLRLWVKPEYENNSVVLLLFRKFLVDSWERGFRGYLAHVCPTNGLERRLIPLCRHAGGEQAMMPQVALVGRIEKALRY